jgi:nucleotide-binding universal stress UspA family protein
MAQGGSQMAPFKNMLVPVDFSQSSERALAVACELARGFDASLTLFHAYALPTYPLPDGFIMPSAETVAEILEKTQSAMNQQKARAAQLGAPRVAALVSEGMAYAEIVRVAGEQGFDLIVMGTHGRTGIKHALLGSVAEKVVRKAPCAVLTVRDPAHEPEER